MSVVQQQSILLTVWSTNQMCLYNVLIQGLHSGLCCLAPLVLLHLLIGQADDAALQGQAQLTISLYGVLPADRYDLVPVLGQYRWVFVCCDNNTDRVNLQDECNLEETFLSE